MPCCLDDQGDNYCLDDQDDYYCLDDQDDYHCLDDQGDNRVHDVDHNHDRGPGEYIE